MNDMVNSVYWRVLSLAMIAAFALVLGTACGATTADSGGAQEGGGSNESRSSDEPACPAPCFMSEGSCVMLPDEGTEADRGDQIPVVTPLPCDRI